MPAPAIDDFLVLTKNKRTGAIRPRSLDLFRQAQQVATPAPTNSMTPQIISTKNINAIYGTYVENNEDPENPYQELITTPQDIGTITIPEGIERYRTALGSLAGSGSLLIVVDGIGSPPNHMGGYLFEIRDAANGGGNLLFSGEAPGNAEALAGLTGIAKSSAANAPDKLYTARTLYIRQTQDGGGGGDTPGQNRLSFFITIIPIEPVS